MENIKKIVYGKWGGLTKSIKSLKEKVKENPYFQYREGGVKKMLSFSIFCQILTYDCFPYRFSFYQNVLIQDS